MVGLQRKNQDSRNCGERHRLPYSHGHTMKTSVLIASITAAGSLAFAAGQQTTGKQPPVLPFATQEHFSRGEVSARSSFQQPELDCTQGEPLNWFGSIRLLPWTPGAYFCGGSIDVPFSQYTAEDMNRDGHPDRLTLGGWLRVKGVDQDWSIGRVEFRLLDAPPRVEISSVLSREQFMNWFSATYPGDWDSIGVAVWSRNDFDADGDLDLALQCIFQGATNGGNVLLWVENVAVPPVAAADLTGDGVVNGADLAVVLGNWTASE
jgi:hypothetical protein